MASQKNPMSLEDLPKYLESARKNGKTGSAPVVEMGKIESGFNWTKIFAAIAICLGLGIGGIGTYNAIATKEFTVAVSVNEDTKQSISELIAQNDGEILSLDKKEDSTYLVKVSTRKSKRLFLDWLKKHKDINGAKIEE